MKRERKKVRFSVIVDTLACLGDRQLNDGLSSHGCPRAPRVKFFFFVSGSSLGEFKSSKIPLTNR